MPERAWSPWPGASPERLAQVRESLSGEARSWPILTADASAPSTLREMAARTQVVVTTVGPYAKYGLPLVEACAAAGTDYADLTGEPNFIRDSIDLYHKQAVDTGARIVHSCGFDSIPSDLTVYTLFRQARDDGSGELLDTNLVVRRFSGGLSGGTLASMLEVLAASSKDAGLRDQISDPYTPDPGSRCRTRTRRPTRCAVAPGCGDRTRIARHLDGGVRHGVAEQPELCGAATHYWAIPTAAVSPMANR